MRTLLDQTTSIDTPKTHLSSRFMNQNHPTGDSREIWDKEYQFNASIPSSHRSTPSHALVDVEDSISYEGSTAIDLGCGNGRNSLYMAGRGASVTAVDYSSVALKLLATSQTSSPSNTKIESLHHDINAGLPFKDESIDIVLDSYCLCHFTDLNSALMAMSECSRVLKPGGKFIKIHLDVDDQYYLERIEKRTGYGHLSFDPKNKIRKAHFSVRTYLEFAGAFFSNSNQISRRVEFIDQVRDLNYKRSIFVCILEK